ncbi:hypothetical protein [Pseudohalioglobus lutimaris]|uniref:SF3 helicase domain-containing protein n=1 Tax=Pseudohalioglobus lutimaris TaxID=1737061 RepID=A0A2N5X0X6_9GAMM|nr:hypothetical protein [Pseudohalioglobus lutimaris]PLW68152.1 hypothetical protein C0039_13230 [Pseudohalioglobus lutimaris]
MSINPHLEEVANMDEEKLLSTEASDDHPFAVESGQTTEPEMGSTPDPDEAPGAYTPASPTIDSNSRGKAATPAADPADEREEASTVENPNESAIAPVMDRAASTDLVDTEIHDPNVDANSPANSQEPEEATPAVATSPPQVKTSGPPSIAAIALAYIREQFELTFTADGTAYAVDNSSGHPRVYRVDSARFASAIRKLVYLKNPALILTADIVREIQGQLSALAELIGQESQVWLRVAQLENGIEIDRGDTDLTRFRITAGEVEVITQGSETLFHREPSHLPFPYPAEKGDIGKLLPYLNVEESQKRLLVAWVTYTLAHSKVSSTNYVVLVLRGDRGSGKSTMCNVILGSLVGPTTLGVQAFPGNEHTLAIVAQTQHVGMFDNIRSFTPSQQDQLCRAATRATVSTRKLYTDGEAFTQSLHFAPVLNGIHPFIDQDDLAQRCLTIKLQPLDSEGRETEQRLQERFERDLPVIFRGALDLIAEIFTRLPTVNVKYPERMLEFSQWLAAMEEVLNLPAGELQKAYRDNLVQAMHDSLEDDPLAEAILQFAKGNSSIIWRGTPQDLFNGLTRTVPADVLNTANWPRNAISLSLRLKKLRPKLSGAGVEVTVGKRGKEREIAVHHTGRSS